MNAYIADLLTQHGDGQPFRVHMATISEADAAAFVRLRRDPKQFKPTLFDGDWSVPDEHAAPGEIKLLTVLTDATGVGRVVGRQGRRLYAYPE